MPQMRSVFLISFLTAAAASAQSLSIGVIGGAPFTDVVNGRQLNNYQAIARSTNFTIGPSLQVNLPLSLRLEVDGLYRPSSFNLSAFNPVTASTTSVSAYQIRVPVLLQYRFGSPIVKPFIEGGLSFDHLGGVSDAIKSSLASGPDALLHQNDTSVVLGGGVEAKIPLFRISGELRYTRQTVSNFANISNVNQAEVLVGIHF